MFETRGDDALFENSLEKFDNLGPRNDVFDSIREEIDACSPAWLFKTRDL